jgi:hypothetical protein
VNESYGARTVKRYRRTNAELDVIDETILEVLADEHPATLRGVFYRVMSAGAVEKSEAGYRVVGRQVLKLRRAGGLPYSWITDGTRWIVKPGSWRDVETMLAAAASSYRRMLWRSQPVDVHFFTEKDAIVGVINQVTGGWDVPLGVLRGYASESFCWTVAESIKHSGKPAVFYQLGDHDPSGVDAWRDFADKIQRFAPDSDVTFTRLAVTPEQINDMNLPTRPTKATDTRSGRFAGESVEVDAIPPSTLRAMVKDVIVSHIDAAAYTLTLEVERRERAGLLALIGDVTL